MKKIILILSFLLVGCDKEVDRKPYIDKVNQDFVNEANVLFDGKAGDLKGYSSYSSNTVSYKIKADEFKINIFFNKKDKQLKEMGWKYHQKYNKSYIFCRDKRQLEIIAPRVVVGNKELAEGSVAMQLNDDWHVIFYKANNTTSYICHNYK